MQTVAYTIYLPKLKEKFTISNISDEFEVYQTENTHPPI